MSDETPQERFVRLLRDAHAAADNGEYEDAAELAAVALDEWRKADD